MGLLLLLIFFMAGGFLLVKLFVSTVSYVFKPMFEAGFPDGGIQVQTVTNGVGGDIEQPKEESAIIVKEPKFNADKIQPYEGEETKAFEFRPQTWEQFISQESAKERAKTIMKKAQRGIRSHLILSAIKGHGKTTFIELLAKSLGAHLIQRVGKQIDEDELVNIINEINTSQAKHVVFFCDELETMDWKVIKILNPIIEQFKINGRKIKPFIFAGATINKHILIKNNPDTLDRIPHHIQFTRYTAEDIAKIIKQYRKQLYPGENVPEEIIAIISQSSKFNPRTSIALLEDFIVEQDIEKVLKNCHIVKDGLTLIDIKLLETLKQAKKPMGANALSMKVGLSQDQYLQEYEPFLCEFDYIQRTPSRSITSKGMEFLKELS